MVEHEPIIRRHYRAVIIGAVGIPYGLVCFTLGRGAGCVTALPVDGSTIWTDALPASAYAGSVAGYSWTLIVAVIAIAAGIVPTILLAGMPRKSITIPDHAHPTDRRRDSRIAACVALQIRVTPTQYPAAEAALLNASTGGLALAWQGPTLPTNSRVELSIDGYSAVHAVVMAHDGSLLRLRFADASSRGEKEWLRSACMSSRAEP